MRIFVTGATGFVGAHFVERALAAGHAVTGLHHAELRAGGIGRQLRERGAVLVRGDLLEPQKFAGALQGVDCVCHFAGAFREAGADERYFQRINVEGSRELLQAAAAQGVRRFVYCSTAGVHGQRIPGVVDERTPLQPFNSYERSKVNAETAVREGASARGLEYVILRPTAVYGPRDLRLQKLFRSAARGRFPLFGRGEGRRHMVYVTDLADAFLRACESPAAANETFIIGGPRAAPLHEMLQTLAQAANRKRFGPRLPLGPMMALAGVVEDVCVKLKVQPPIYRRRMDFYLNDAEFDCTHAQRVLGWRPRVDLAEGLALTLASMQDEGARVRATGGAVVARSAAGVWLSLFPCVEMIEALRGARATAEYSQRGALDVLEFEPTEGLQTPPA